MEISAEEKIAELEAQELAKCRWYLYPEQISDSVPVDEITPSSSAWLSIAKDWAINKWVKSVDPIETIEIHGDDIIHPLEQGISTLRKRECDPTVLYGNPQWLQTIMANSAVITLKDADWSKVQDAEIAGLKFYGNILTSCDDGLYLFDNRNAQLYIAGDTCAYWNVRPLVVRLVTEQVSLKR